MKIVELSRSQFEEFANNHPLRNHYQSYNYGQLLSEYYFEYYLIGYVDNNDSIKAASLILTNKVTKIWNYAYAPKGYLIDYNDEGLVKSFTHDLKKYLKSKRVVMLKINPEIIIGEIREENNFQTVYNDNVKIANMLAKYDYVKLRNNLYFEAQQPRFNMIINLTEFKGIAQLKKNVRNKIYKSERRGLYIQMGGIDDIEPFFNLIKEKKPDKKIEYYRDYYNVFNRDKQIDIILVKVDYEKYLISAQQRYNEELSRNESLIEELQKTQDEKVLARKMQSDHDLASFKSDIVRSSKNIGQENTMLVAAAYVIKYTNRAYILFSSYSEQLKFLNAYHYLHYKIIEYYKNLGFDSLDMNGMTGDFTKKNPFNGLNQFKLGFNPVVYEYIGEFDLMLKKRKYRELDKQAVLARVFNKPWEKKGALNEKGEIVEVLEVFEDSVIPKVEDTKKMDE